MDRYAFCMCTGLTSIKIPPSMTYVSESCFKDCTNLASVSIPKSILVLGYNAFSRVKALKRAVVPERCTFVWDHPVDFPFDKHVKVIRSNSWQTTGPYVMMRNMVENERATELQTAENEELETIKHFIVNANDDIFRYTLEFVVKQTVVSYPTKDNTIKYS